MAFNFPNAPTLNQTYSGYRWDGEKWVSSSVVTGQYVLKAGDTMTGTLAFSSGDINVTSGKIDASGNLRSTAANVLAQLGVYSGYGTVKTGSFYFGSDGSKSVNCDGTNYSFSSGNLTVNGTHYTVGDSYVYRSGAPTTGYRYFGNTGTKYLGYDGTNYFLQTGFLFIVPNASQISTMWCCNASASALGGFAASTSSTNVYSNGAGSTGMYIATNTNAWTAISDARLEYKKSARPVNDALYRLDHIQLYENEVEGRLELFGKAQEIYRAFPHVVKKGSDDNDYVPTGMDDEKAWGVSYERMSIVALQAVKELLAKVEMLEAKLERK